VLDAGHQDARPVARCSYVVVGVWLRQTPWRGLYATYQFALPAILMSRLTELRVEAISGADVAYVPFTPDLVTFSPACWQWFQSTAALRANNARHVPHLHFNSYMNTHHFPHMRGLPGMPSVRHGAGGHAARAPAPLPAYPFADVEAGNSSSCRPRVFVAHMGDVFPRRAACYEFVAVPYPSAHHLGPHATGSSLPAFLDRPVVLGYAGNMRIGYLNTLRAGAGTAARMVLQEAFTAMRRTPVTSPLQAIEHLKLNTSASWAPTDATLAVIDLYRRSRYCLVPTGDGITRKAFGDAVGAGCIPVVYAGRRRDVQHTFRWDQPRCLCAGPQQ